MEVVLARRVVAQPVPNLQHGGDCGACVLGGLVGKSVQWVYDTFQEGRYKSFHWREMHDALLRAERFGLLDRVVTDVPIWPASFHQSMASWCLPNTAMSLAWFAYVTMAFDAGYYGLALVDIHKRGMYGGGTNHWVLLAGARERREPFEDGGGSRIDNELLISCSSTRTPDEEWVEVSDFLRERGGFNLLLARPAQ